MSSLNDEQVMQKYYEAIMKIYLILIDITLTPTHFCSLKTSELRDEQVYERKSADRSMQLKIENNFSVRYC